MNQITTKDYSELPIDDITDITINNLSVIAGKRMSEIVVDNSHLLVFPDSLDSFDVDFGNKTVCFITGDKKLKTNSVVGFVGYNQTQLSITSRFADDRGNDYFLHYLLQKISKGHIVGLNHSFNEDGVLDFLKYLFPVYLKDAVRQGLFKKYRTIEHNDSNVRGVIDIGRHIKYNEPFVGKIAYRSREYSFDNDVTQLVRHTIEYLARTPGGMDILKCDEETYQSVKIISDATRSYSHRELQHIINRNLQPVTHPFFVQYGKLQRLCLQILRHEEMKYGQANNKIYGVLIDAAWLWEEYLAEVLVEQFNHCLLNSGQKFYLFKNEKQQIVPDYLSKDRNKTIVADAKYISLNDNNKEFVEEKATDLFYKTIAYMTRFSSDTGVLIYPDKNAKKNDGIKREHYHLITEDKSAPQKTIAMVGVPIPTSFVENYSEFAEKMQIIEKSLRKYFEDIFQQPADNN